jgi:hypothetical protein
MNNCNIDYVVWHNKCYKLQLCLRIIYLHLFLKLELFVADFLILHCMVYFGGGGGGGLVFLGLCYFYLKKFFKSFK